MKWWQRWAGLGIDLAKRILDDSQPADKLQAFLQAGLEKAAAKDPLPNQEVSYAQLLAADLGLISPKGEISSAHPQLPSQSEFIRWREDLDGDRVISRDGLAPGAGLMLLSVLDDPGHQSDFLQSQLEQLLRRIEVKRRSALDSAGELDTQADWMERHAIAILLSRAARQSQDLRFLNAALKLNDWAFPSHNNLPPNPKLDRYLWSLAEQETSWKALLG
jgi:hypothetical protein